MAMYTGHAFYWIFLQKCQAPYACMHRSPGRGLTEEQRVRLANVMAMGAVQLFVGDIQSGATLFQPMWHTLCYEVSASY